MHNVSRIAIAAATMALAASTLAAPVSAADKSALAFVNGFPDKQIDVCVNGKEIRSRLRYGRTTAKVMGVGQKNIKIFKSDPRRCKGKKLAQTTFDLTLGSESTIVLGKNTPRLRIFNNAPFGVIPRGPLPLFGKSVVILRHAADVGTTNFLTRVWTPGNENSFQPAAPHKWERGDAGDVVHEKDLYVRVRATMDVAGTPLGRSRTVLTKMGQRYEFYLVGTSVANAKLVLLARSVGED